MDDCPPAAVPSMTEKDRDEYVQLLISCQPQLFSYICALLGGVQDANNVLQETNLVLWKKADEFKSGTSFVAWALEVAYFKALSHSRDKMRCRLVLDQEMVEKMLAIAQDDIDERRVALRHCLSKLVDPHRELLRQRYQNEEPVKLIAKSINRTEASVKMTLRRIRLSLRECITRRMRIDRGLA
jgi:RNA polymerase sigma-70 factor (ECF subfamily)